MPDNILVPVAVALGGAASFVLAYFGLRFTKSGRIDTTEAAQFWNEARDIRAELKLQLALMETRLIECEKRHTDSTTEVARLIKQIEKLEFEALRKDQTIGQQMTQIQQLTTRVAGLEAKA